MAKKKDNKLWIIVIAIAALILFAQPGGISNTSTNVQKVVDTFKDLITGKMTTTNAPLGNPKTDFLSIRLYDKDGNLIEQTNPETQSIVTVGGVTTRNVYFMDYTIMVDASTSGTDISCTLQSVEPAGSAFDITKSCGPGGTATMPDQAPLDIIAGAKETWTSAKLALPGPAGCILSGTYTISATVRCTYWDGTLQVPVTTALGDGKTIGTFGPITITEAGAAGYTVSVNSGGIPTEYCGDGVCQSPMESASTCTIDCNPAGNVKFRTSDLSYVSGGAIAYTGTCGNTLNKYGYVSFSCNQVTDPTCPALSEYTLRMNNLPGYPSWSSPSYSGCLYTQNAFSFTDNGLISYWKLDTDNSRVIDSEGTVNGTIYCYNNGASFTSTGHINGAFNFNAVACGAGSGYYVPNIYIDSSPTLNSVWGSDNSYSLVLWFNPSANSNGAQGLFHKESNPYPWGLRYIPTSSVQAVAYDGTSNPYIQTAALSLGNWHFIVMTYDATQKTVKLYLDNSLSSSRTFNPAVILKNTATIRIGSRGSPSFPREVNGIIDEVMIYNRTLSSSEINQIYIATSNQRNIPTTTPSNIALSWKQTATIGPCSSVNEWGLINYNSASSYASLVQDQKTSFDIAKEVTC